MKRKPPWKRTVAIPRERPMSVKGPKVELAPWEIVRDILYRAELPRNDPGAYCPGGIYERVSKEIAAALASAKI